MLRQNKADASFARSTSRLYWIKTINWGLLGYRALGGKEFNQKKKLSMPNNKFTKKWTIEHL